MGREHPAPKPFMDASIYFISRKDPKKKIEKKKQDRMAKWGTERYTIMFWVYDSPRQQVEQ